MQHIVIDVGGKYFKTFLHTIQQYPETRLGRLFSGNFNIREVPFFDRSSFLFDFILNFYRTGILSKPIFVEDDIWEAELRYWEIDLKFNATSSNFVVDTYYYLHDLQEKLESLDTKMEEIVTKTKEG